MEGNWYAMFETYNPDGSVRRMGTPQGPFDSQEEAEERIEAFKTDSEGGDELSPLSNAQALARIDVMNEMMGRPPSYRFWAAQLDDDEFVEALRSAAHHLEN